MIHALRGARAARWLLTTPFTDLPSSPATLKTFTPSIRYKTLEPNHRYQTFVSEYWFSRDLKLKETQVACLRRSSTCGGGPSDSNNNNKTACCQCRDQWWSQRQGQSWGFWKGPSHALSHQTSAPALPLCSERGSDREQRAPVYFIRGAARRYILCMMCDARSGSMCALISF